MKKKKVVLINPPGRYRYTRDYYCSKVAKANYVEQPMDLVVLSGFLNSDYDMLIIDAVVDGLSVKECLRRIDYFKPDYLISLSGLVSWKEDFEFLSKVKASHRSCKIIGTGDIFRNEEIFYSNPWLDAITLDFSNGDINAYMEDAFDSMESMIFRNDEGEITSVIKQKKSGELFEIPVPIHKFFLAKKYTFPFVRSLPFATILTDFGCPYSCTYCVYSKIASKIRRAENTIEELKYLHDLGVRELFIKDQTFGYSKEQRKGLCDYLSSLNEKFGWTCFLRAEIIDEELVRDISSGGCHTVIIGFESGSDAILSKYKKGCSRAKLVRAVEILKKFDIRIVGTFILGFPEDTLETINNTIRFAKESVDFAAFNLFVPKLGTKAREELVETGAVPARLESEYDQSGISSSKGVSPIHQTELRRIRRRAILTFFLRPSYIWRRIKEIRTMTQFVVTIKNGLAVFH